MRRAGGRGWQKGDWTLGVWIGVGYLLAETKRRGVGVFRCGWYKGRYAWRVVGTGIYIYVMKVRMT